MAGRTHGSSRAKRVVRSPCSAPRHPALRHQLCVGFDEQCAPGLRWSAARCDLRLLSARVPAGGRRIARARSGARGDRALSRRERLGMFPAGRPSPASPGPPRRRAARRPRHADRVRRLRAAALPDLHHRALRPIPHWARRPRDLAARARSRRAVPCVAVCGIPSARRCALRARWRRSETNERGRRLSAGRAFRSLPPSARSPSRRSASRSE